MNWSKAKTILIIFLSCITVFLVCVLIFSSIETSKTSDDVINYSVDILTSHGIKINPDLILKKVPTAKQITVANIISDKQLFADLAAGEPTTIIDDAYCSKNTQISYFDDSFCITFLNPIPNANLQGYLKEIGIDISDSEFQHSETTKIYTKKISGTPVYDCTISVTETSDGIKSISGCWFDVSEVSQKIQVRSMADALVSFALKNDFLSNPINITKINLVYAISDEQEYQIQTTLTPMYELCDNNGVKYYIDASNY